MGGVFVVAVAAGLAWWVSAGLVEPARVFVLGAVVGVGLWELARVWLRPAARRLRRRLSAIAKEL